MNFEFLQGAGTEPEPEARTVRTAFAGFNAEPELFRNRFQNLQLYLSLAAACQYRCEVVYFLAYHKGTLPLKAGHLTTTTSLLLFVFSCCVVSFILNNP